jgi:hypothetical protein
MKNSREKRKGPRGMEKGNFYHLLAMNGKAKIY